MAVALSTLDKIVEKSNLRLAMISGKIGVELINFSEKGGTRILRAKLAKDSEIQSISARYEGDVEKWGFSYGEKAYIIRLARDSVFEDDPGYNGHSVSLPDVGQYFSIEGHTNFLKSCERETDSLEISCGTGNSTYFRLYKGTFYEFGDWHRKQIVLNGKSYYKDSEGSPWHLQDEGIFEIFKLNDGRYNHMYK